MSKKSTYWGSDLQPMTVYKRIVEKPEYRNSAYTKSRRN